MMASCDNSTRGVAGGPARHIPVMLPEVVAALAPADNEFYIDGTFGAGGYTRAILEAADCRVVAIDRDPEAIAAGQDMVEEFAGRLTLMQGTFSDMLTLVEKSGFPQVHGVTLDIGVSSMQIDTPERGFSFQHDGPLDMRMASTGPSAADVVNQFDESDLADIIFVLGEERRSRAIARAIAAARKNAPISRTGELAELVSRALGGRRGAKRHPATKTFQALRAFVNRELEELIKALYAAEAVLCEGGRLVVVAFHSLEDRIVKRFLANAGNTLPAPSRHMPVLTETESVATFNPLFRGSHAPQDEETSVNPRARSARLRAAIRTDAPARALDLDKAGLPRLPALSQLSA